MSTESVKDFLAKAAMDLEIQEKFKAAKNSQEFLEMAKSMGYDFTTDEMKAVVKQNSEGVLVRRQTGIWKWLRTVNWI